MQAAEGGRHCDRCDRVVRDLTGMSEAEILRQVALEPELCGRMRARPAAQLGLSLAMLALASCTPWAVSEQFDVVEPTHWASEPTVPEEPVEYELGGYGEFGIGGLRMHACTTVGAMIAVPEVGDALGSGTTAEPDELPFTLSGDVKIKQRRRRRRRP